ncbi:MAG: phosphatidate cytidylyltransferase [Bacteroidia bacterium]|nr:phosphatidate cytidylyltransferase [Bacteroidia bacterium]
MLRRIGTAVVAGALLLSFLYWAGKVGLLIAWLLIGLLLLDEWMRGEHLSLPQRIFLSIPILALWGSPFLPELVKGTVLSFVLLALWGLRQREPQTVHRWFQQSLYGLVGMGVGWGSVGWLLYEPYSFGRTLAFLSLVWMADTAAYFGGRWMGRRRILPQISPNKTVEGLGISVIASAIWGHFAVPWVGGLEEVPPFLVGGGVSLLAFIGDAYQSVWKRVHQLKDSGRLLPGHGGIWDRVDSLIWVAPAWYFLS